MTDDPEVLAWINESSAAPTPPPKRKLDAEMLAHLRRFIGPSQLRCMLEGARGEEGQFFREKLWEIYALTLSMPETYDQEELGENAIIHLHYFAGGQANWWITERDKEPVQHQAFGLADLFGDGGELGYISIVEILQNRGELDLHWIPKTIKQLRERNK